MEKNTLKDTPEAILGQYGTLTTLAMCKWGQFERAKLILKTLRVKWVRSMFKGGLNFQRVTVCLCRSKGCKIWSVNL